MLRLLKITGESMSPDFQEGDFVAIATVPFILKRLKIGDTIIFEHKLYGTLIKRVRAFEEVTGDLYVEGTQENSLDSRRLGPIRQGSIRGKVVVHIKKPGKTY